MVAKQRAFGLTKCAEEPDQRTEKFILAQSLDETILDSILDTIVDTQGELNMFATRSLISKSLLLFAFLHRCGLRALDLNRNLVCPLLCSLMFVTMTNHVAANTDDGNADQSEQHGRFIGAMETVYPDWFKTSFLELEDDVAEAAEQGKRLMIIFHQDGCPYCNALIEHNLSQKDIEDTLKSKFDVLDINMWGDREVASVDGQIYTEKTFAAALKVQFTPTVLFLDESGGLALRINGYYNPERFRLVLDYVSGQFEKQMSFNEYTEKFGKPDTSEKLEAKPYLSKIEPQSPLPDGAHDKPYILLFEQADCNGCQTMHESVLSDDTTQELLEPYDVFQIDMWGNAPLSVANQSETTSGRKLARELDINYAPSLVIFSADGNEIIRAEASFKKFHTQSLLDYVASDDWQQQPNFQRYLSARAESMRERGIDVNIWD